MSRLAPIILLVAVACGDPAAHDRDVDAQEVSDASDASDPSDGSDSSDGADAPDIADTGDTIDTIDTIGDVSPLVPDGWLSALTSAADLALLADADGEVKYLASLVGKAPPAPLTPGCYFQDMHRWEFHIQFLRTIPGLEALPLQAYTAMVLARPTRVFWGGAVAPYPAALHPRTGVPGVIVYTVYSDDLVGSLTGADLVEADATLEGCIPFARDLLVFRPANIIQRQLTIQQAAILEAGDVDVIMPEALRPGLTAEAYVQGEGYGTLRVVPADELVLDYGPRDILIAASAPNDISVVQGLVTRDPQSVHSHVNLRLAEKGVPSASVSAIYDNALVRTYDGKLVHLVVSGAGVVIQPATLEDAEAFWEARRPDLPEPVADLEVTALTGFDGLRHADAIAFGVKAANLGELHALLPSEHRVEGFGIPFAHYVEFVDASPLAARITTMLADPRMTTDATFARTTLDALREAFEDTPLPAPLMSALTARLREVFGPGVDTTRVRFRSSTNAEDLDVLSGAGLYDSRSGCLADDLDGDALGPSRCLSEAERTWMEAELATRTAELAAHPERTWLAAIIEDLEGDLGKEKTVARAVRKVWASLWNERAFEERAFYGIDHTKVFMGIAVEPSFVLERANAVAVTNLPATSGGPVYRLVSQTGWLSVVRPEDPLAIAEVLTFQRDGDARAGTQLLVGSSLLPAGQGVWSEAELDTIAALLYQVQDHFAASVYPDLAGLALDLEIKRTHDDRIVIKQARPYLGAGE